jgi:hypothetical protein
MMNQLLTTAAWGLIVLTGTRPQAEALIPNVRRFSSRLTRKSFVFVKSSNCGDDRLGPSSGIQTQKDAGRRDTLGLLIAGAFSLLPMEPKPARAANGPDTLDIDDFLRNGQGTMGVSSQTGKSRPETGVVLRDGSEVSQDFRTGDVSAEILLRSAGNNERVPVLVSYQSPWPLATGTVFDVECRDAKTGDGAFITVTSETKGQPIESLPADFFVSQLSSPIGRLSFYGSPTDMKVLSSEMVGNKYRVLDLSYSTLTQSTQTEIPRRAKVVATVPEGTKQAVMLVSSSSALRWKRGLNQQISSVAASFLAIPAPKSSIKVRAKSRLEAV